MSRSEIARLLCRGILNVLRCALICVLLAPVAYSQGQQRSTGQRLSAEKIDELIGRVKAGKFDPMELVQLADSGAPQAAQVLKEQFALSATPAFIKEHIAYGLIKLGEKDQTYWDFLVMRAKAAVESDAPFTNSFDPQGKIVPRQLAPEFIEWAKAHNLPANDAAYAQAYDLPGSLLFLARTGDPRGRDLLRRGMASRNYFIQAAAAKGLAKLKDKESVPLIIEACRKAPEEVAVAIAWALVFFDDPQAQAAAERFITNKEMLEGLRKIWREKGIDGIL